ncbi:MAG: polysaccharide biosynthesis protein, partial [Cyclobacteriaceae bacterium]|nr:polysaccharide biosynthesis protein [Cyclobacteriaceae bacterium]
IEENSGSQYKVIGYLDDDKKHIGKVVNGVNIFDARKDLETIINTKNVKELIISERNISIERKNELVDICLAKNIKVRIVPPVEHWVKGELSLNQIKNINIEELLERDSIKLDNYNVTEELKGRKVMVTGAAGSIGSEIVRQTLYYNPELIILVDQAESDLFEIENELKLKKGTLKIYPIVADITSEKRMERIFQDYKPQIIFHAAAYKHVPMMEKNPDEAVHCNINGTKILADLAVKYNSEKFVMISTDKAVNPSNVMGASKRIAEMYVQSLNNYLKEKNPDATKFITTRFGNVLGSNGSVIPVFKKQIDQGGPITVTHPEITRFFMTIPEACQLVLEAGAMGEGGEIFVFDMGKSIKIVDLAKKMVKLSGLEVGTDIEIVFTGLRSGEKLYEELLSSHENTLPTYHHKILIAKTREVQYENVKRDIQVLLNSVQDHDELKLVGIMKYIVPEFISNSSKFEVLDKKKA